MSISTIFIIEILSISTILFNVRQFNQSFARSIRICPLCTWQAFVIVNTVNTSGKLMHERLSETIWNSIVNINRTAYWNKFLFMRKCILLLTVNFAMYSFLQSSWCFLKVKSLDIWNFLGKGAYLPASKRYFSSATWIISIWMFLESKTNRFTS